MERIGVVSDTHGRLDPRVGPALEAAGCTTIVHAGDIGDPRILDELAAYGEVVAVLGNNDFSDYGPSVGSTASFTVDGVRFFVAHTPRDARISPRSFPPGARLPHVCIHGHTHVPELVTGKDASPATLIFCPGSTFRPRGGMPRSFGLIDVDGGTLTGAQVLTLDGEPLLTYPPDSTRAPR